MRATIYSFDINVTLGGWPSHARPNASIGERAHGGLVRLYPNPYGLRGIERVSIPNESKSLSIRINPL
jgi:hypothetical protein